MEINRSGNKRIASIVGTVFCGSTALGLCLEEYLRFCFMGEINRLNFIKNDFRIEDKEFRQNLQNDSFFNLIELGERSKFWEKILARKPESFSDLITHISQSLRKDQWLLEDSKFPDWIDYLSETNPPDLMILLFRHPYKWLQSHCRSFSNKNTDTDASLDLYVSNYSWHIVNACFYKIPMVIVSFEQFCSNPGRTLDMINVAMSMIDNEPLQRIFVPNKIGGFVRRSNAIGGNIKSYLLNRQFYNLYLKSNDDLFREIISRYSTFSKNQIEHIVKNAENYEFLTKEIGFCDDLKFSNDKQKKALNLFNWLMKNDGRLLSQTDNINLPPEILSVADGIKARTVSDKRVIQSLELEYLMKNQSLQTVNERVFKKFRTAFIDEKNSTNLPLVSSLSDLTDKLQKRLSQYQIKIIQQQVELKSLKDQLINMEAQINFLKEIINKK